MLVAAFFAALVVGVFSTEHAPDIEALPRGVPYNRWSILVSILLAFRMSRSSRMFKIFLQGLLANTDTVNKQW